MPKNHNACRLNRWIFWGCFFLLFSTRVFADNTIPYHWLELGPNNQWLARLVTTETNCPQLKVSHGHTLPMQPIHPGNHDFPLTVCQAILPQETKSATVKNISFRLPKPLIRKIVIMGDTGCRLLKGQPPQACNDPKQWPFPVVTRSAAAWKPDLVIHVGDYLYREAKCPPGDAACLGTPHGDNWPTWEADFFKPAKPLLQTAPWIVVRGNHETCTRAGKGWSRLLDPFIFKHCLNHSPLYSVDIGKQPLFIIDSANANDFVAPEAEVDTYENYLQQLAHSHVKHAWIVTHKPFWFVFDEEKVNQALQTYFLNTLQMAWENVNPQQVDWMISGHLHRFQVLNFSSGRPTQLIVGTSGTLLDLSFNKSNLKGFRVAGDKISEGVSLSHFGYMTLERKTTYWKGQIRDPYGRSLANCVLKNQQILCHETWRAKYTALSYPK